MKHLWLGIETSGTHLGLALHDLSERGAPAVARSFEPVMGRQAELLFPTLDRLMRAHRLRRSDLAAVAVDEGPGSFTGVRIGVAAARAVAQSLGLPLVGVSSLEAMAWAADFPDKDATVVARMPALATETYFAAFRTGARGWTVVSPPAWTTDAEFDKRLARLAADGPLAVVMIERPKGDAFVPPSGAAVHRVPAPDPSALVSLAVARSGRRPAARRHAPDRVVPVYLQPSWAERRGPMKKK